jgi:putative ABC transport system permease protein
VIRPILAALKHHKTAAVLVALEIALTCAIITNALFIVGDRLGAMRVTTGVANDELVWVRSSGTTGGGVLDKANAEQAADLAALRAMPGVRSAIAINALPLSRRSWAGGLWTSPGGKATLENVVFYVGTPGMVETLGLKLVEGRDFNAQEYVDYSPFQNSTTPTVAIVTRALAERLWPGKEPLGQVLYQNRNDDSKAALHVVGVVEHLLNPQLGRSTGPEFNYLLPVTDVRGGMYVLRTAPTARDGVLRDLPAVLDRVDDRRVIESKGTEEGLVRDYFHDDRALVWLLLAVVGALLALTVLGVVGLSSFWVQQRIRTIGIRRAIGATQRDIRRYFQIENLLIVSIGAVVGSVAAVLLNLWLMKHYELPHMPLWMVAPGLLLLCAIGQLAVLVPAQRAARVPPVVATRSA